MNKYIESDLFRYYGKYNMSTLVYAILKNRTFRYQCILRLCQTSGISKWGGVLLWKLNRTKRKIQIPRRTKIGYGLFIVHEGPIVINPEVVIGNNVNLSQFTTIGSNYKKGAIIGDNVYIGPNVCIVEDVVIGDNVSIGAGSVVTKDIPTNATVAGNYAKVLNFDDPGRFIQNPWINIE